jgi:quercetin dioxygenase-like cupin family protein
MRKFAHVRRRGAGALVAAAALVLVGCGSDAASEDPFSTASTAVATGAVEDAVTTTTAASTEVVKDVLGQVDDPPGAPDSMLTLIRYTIPPGAKLAPHIHPGVQLARIESGTLSYTIREGSAVVRRAGADADERVPGPTTIRLEPGDTVTELDGMVHFGANETDEPIVIVATLLTTDGEDLAVPVDDAAS